MRSTETPPQSFAVLTAYPHWALVAVVVITHLSPAAGATLFWTNGGRTLSSANTDGSNRRLLLDQEFGLPTGIVVNERDDQLFWVEVLEQRRIRRAALDGSGIVDVLDLGTNNPGGIDLDLSANHMYWTERFSNRVRRANLDGTEVETLVVGAVEPRAIAVDPARGYMYWAEVGTSQIRRANLDGTDPIDFAPTSLSPSAVEVDVSTGDVYWTEFDSSVSSRPGNVHRTDATGSFTETIATGLLQPSGIAYDGTSDSLWLAHGLNFTIDQIDLSTGERREAFTGVGLPQYVALRAIPEPASAAMLSVMLAAAWRAFGIRRHRPA